MGLLFCTSLVHSMVHLVVQAKNLGDSLFTLPLTPHCHTHQPLTLCSVSVHHTPTLTTCKCFLVIPLGLGLFGQGIPGAWASNRVKSWLMWALTTQRRACGFLCSVGHGWRRPVEGLLLQASVIWVGAGLPFSLPTRLLLKKETYFFFSTSAVPFQVTHGSQLLTGPCFHTCPSVIYLSSAPQQIMSPPCLKPPFLVEDKLKIKLVE